MNDEQFELAMLGLDDIGLSDGGAQLRARDTAQREALARVEAELAEALGEIRIYQQKFRYIAEGGSFYLSTAAECVRLTSSFLAMHANTAQGAHAGDLASAVRVLLEVPQLQGEQAFSARPIINRVRAALTTQPAAGEPVAIANRGKGVFWVRWTDAAEGLYGPGIKLYAEPPAAAHGDELVAVVGTVPDGSGFKSLDFKVDLQDLPDGTRLYAQSARGAPT